MLVKEVVGCLKVHEVRLRGYEDKEEEKYLLLTHEEWLTRTKMNNATDFFFTSMRECGSQNKKNRDGGRGCGRDHGHPYRRGGRGGLGNTSQTYDNVNSWKDKSMIKCYSYEKYGHYGVECRKKKRDDEANLTLMQDQEPAPLLAEKNAQRRKVHGKSSHKRNHMTRDRTKFKERVEKLIGNVKFGDGSFVPIQGKVSILFSAIMATNVY